LLCLPRIEAASAGCRGRNRPDPATWVRVEIGADAGKHGLEGAALDAIDQRDADVDATVETRPMTSATPLKTLDISGAGAGRSASVVEKFAPSCPGDSLKPDGFRESRGEFIGRCRTTPSMKSGGGVLLVSALQLIVGLVILFIYEGYKGHYLSHSGSSPPPSAVPTENGNETTSITIYERGGGLMATTPMDGIFVYSMVINVFALCGLAGMLSQNKHLVLGFFAYNAVNLVVSFHVFVDVCTTIGVRVDATKDSAPYAKGVAAFLFFNFCLSCVACVFAVKAVDEIREKNKSGEGYSVMHFGGVEV
jgi:hypothetical protein